MAAVNDLERLLRDELRTRADAAGRSADRQPARLAAGLEHRIRRARRRRRLAITGTAALAVAAAITIPLAVLARPASPGLPVTSGRHPKLSDPSLTPPGWTAIPYRGAQLSVPNSWVVQGPQGSICNVTTRGGLLLGRHSLAALRRAGCRLPTTTVLMAPAPPGLPRPDGLKVNGIPVVRVSKAAVAVPSLGVEVTAVGPKALRVLATLTRSVLRVVLAPGPISRVPAGWLWHTMGGVSFAIPGSWSVRRTDIWGNCAAGGPPTTFSGVLLVSTATTGCGLVGSEAPLAGAWAQHLGVSVGYGPLANTGGSPLRCMRLAGLRACIPAYADSGSSGNPLMLAVYPHGAHSQPVIMQIGLAGTGSVARTILDSIKPAAATR